MLNINPDYKRSIATAGSPGEVAALLQAALELEHATVPPYLAAAYTLKRGPNNRLRNLVLEIAVEEMLHMAIVGNIIRAIGGRPRLDEPDFLPHYPGPLPMQVAGNLTVGIRKFSLALVRDVFMKIEEPAKPLAIPGGDVDSCGSPSAPGAYTVGHFYGDLIRRIRELGDSIFRRGPTNQLTGEAAGFPGDQLFPITNSRSAVKALEWVVTEGEGTQIGPFDGEREVAHYYRFQAICRGAHLRSDAAGPDGYSYSGDAIGFDAAGVFDMPDDAKASDYPLGSRVRRAVDSFNRCYSDILRALQGVYDGRPDQMDVAIGKMSSLRALARAALRERHPQTARRGCLSFEYTSTSTQTLGAPVVVGGPEV